MPLVLLLVTLVANARAEVPDLEMVNRVPYGGTYAVAACGDTLYFMDGSVLRAVDVSDPSAPVNLGEIDVQRGWQYSLGCSGNAAYVLADDVILVYDFSIPWQPELAGSISTGGSLEGLAAEDSLLVVWNSDTLFIYGLDTAADPQFLSLVPVGSGVQDIEMVPGFAYVVRSSRVVVVDLNDPTAPEVVSSMGTGFFAHAIEAGIDGRVFLRETWGCRVVSYDASNPVNWAYDDHLDFADNTECIQMPFVLAGSVLMTGVQNGNGPPFEYHQVIDVSDPNTMAFAGTLEHAATMSGNGALLAGMRLALPDLDCGVRLVDVSNAAQPQELSLVENGGSFVDLVRVEGAIAATRGSRGISLFDPAALPEVQAVGSTAVSGRTRYATGAGALLAVQGTLGGGIAGGRVAVLDVGEPHNPVVLEELDIDDTIAGVAMNQATLVLTDFNRLQAYDVTTPGGLTLIHPPIPVPPGSSDWNSTLGNNVALNDEFAYVVSDGGEGTVVDLLEYPAADSTGCFDGGESWIGDLTIADDLLFLAADFLRMFDVSEPMSPVLLSTIPSDEGSYSGSVAFGGGVVFAPGYPGFRIVDVSDPSTPEVVGHHQDVFLTTDVLIEYPYYMVASSYLGITVYVDRNWVFSDDFESGGLEAWSDAE
jgi:hypothetical protein